MKNSKWLWWMGGIAALFVILLLATVFLLLNHGRPPRPPKPVKPKAEPGNLIVNGSFETPAVQETDDEKGLWMFGTHETMKPWETDLRQFELWATGLVPPGFAKPKVPVKSAVGRQNVEVISDPVFKGSIWQSVKTVPGKSYTLSFFHCPRPGAGSKLTVSLNSTVLATFDGNGTNVNTLDWREFTTNFVADSESTKLTFADEAHAIGQGTHLDGVTLKAE